MKFRIQLFFELGGRPVESDVRARNLPDALRKWAKTEGIRVEHSDVYRGKNWRAIRWSGYYIRPEHTSVSAASMAVTGGVFKLLGAATPIEKL